MVTFTDVRAPIVDTADFLLTPVKLSKNIAINTADTLLNVLTGTINEDEKLLGLHQRDRSLSSSSVYGIAKPMLDLSTIMYYYTELRTVAKRRMIRHAEKKRVSTTGKIGSKSEFLVLVNAIQLVESNLKKLSDVGGENSDRTVINEYRKSLKQLEQLRKKLKLDEADIDIFTTFVRILAEPKTLTDIKSDIFLYDDLLPPEFIFFFGGSEFNKEALGRLIDSYCSSFSEAVEETPTKMMPYFHKIDDDFATPSMNPRDLFGTIEGFGSEVVWGIEVNDRSKRITVAFRGSIAPSDWVQNIKTEMVPFMLPGYTDVRTQNNTCSYGSVHKGFYDFLFGKTKMGLNGSMNSKAEEIMGILKSDFFYEGSLREQYSLFVTGHSLGGSLSTLFATRAAALNDFPTKTIMNVSIASPFCGDQEFREEFYKLEMSRRIMHLRLSNDGDIVPLIPATTLILGMVPSVVPMVEAYKHVGMNIRLYDKEAGLASLVKPHIRLFYPKMGSVQDAIRNKLHGNIALNGLSIGIIGKHLCPEYQKRLANDETKTLLEKISLEDLYSNRDITGWSYYD